MRENSGIVSGVKDQTAHSPLIVIIVPVYNVEAYVAGCLRSIQAHTYKHWECLCVDDGSTDASPDIVEEFAARDGRFRLLRQRNGGPGAARNTGLEAASGEYFSFVDADDLVHPELLARLLDLALTHGADLAVCDFFRFERDEKFQQMVRNPELLTGEAQVHRSPLLPKMVDGKLFRVHPVGKLYHRDIHGEVRFPHLYGAEDTYASFDVYGRSTCAVFSPVRLYGYRVREGSLTSSASKYRHYIVACAEVAVHCGEICRAVGSDAATCIGLQRQFGSGGIFLHLYNALSDSRLSEEQKEECRTLAREKLIYLCERSGIGFVILPKKYWILYWLFLKYEIPCILELFCKLRNIIRSGLVRIRKR